MENREPHSGLIVKDYVVTGEEFRLKINAEYGFLETLPRPSADKLPHYYKSEDYISHTSTRRNWFEWTYHWIRSIAVKRKVKLINRFKSKSKTLLDIGCGTGDFLYAAMRSDWTVAGIEPNAQARGMANEKTDHVIYDTVDALSTEGRTFDVITLWHVLEHIPDLDIQISRIKQLLKPKGILVVAVPNYRSFDARYYKSFWAGYDVPRHLWHFNRKAMNTLFSNYNMEIVSTKPMWFDAFYVSLLSEKYKSGKMNILKGIFVGMLSNLHFFRSKEASSFIYVIKKR
ncbi:class I SAM-dependent methyltransferase [Aestuariivivens sediminicola]|uniref:class I SAM-dependent methyltransferase n=1 Tax=Aestuariivivens sediminicola TaxID=2913560 RepID=UPI001F571379|nr:class I SAM-dependent methyltransferase [Aestuariivivens sediminicola]